MIDELPAVSGSYALHLLLPETVDLKVGRLGDFDFPAGDYLYLGSARGPGGLRARLRHHARLALVPHWHLDWLRPRARLLGGWYSLDPGSLECAWSRSLVCLPGAAIPARGFGAADCRSGCPAHLIAFPAGVLFSVVQDRLRLVDECEVSVVSFELS